MAPLTSAGSRSNAKFLVMVFVIVSIFAFVFVDWKQHDEAYTSRRKHIGLSEDRQRARDWLGGQGSRGGIPRRNENAPLIPEKCCYRYHSQKIRQKGDYFNQRRIPRPHRKLRQLDCIRRVPKVFIVGIKSCGTTPLSTFLDLHPLLETVVMPTSYQGLDEDEFSFTEFMNEMPLSRPDELTVVDWPDLIDRPDFLEYLMRELDVPDLKFIVILRDPITRAVSDYTRVADMVDKLEPSLRQRLSSRTRTTYEGYDVGDSFDKTVTDNHGNVNASNLFIQKGLYVDALLTLFHHIPRDRTHVVDGDRLVRNPQATLYGVEKFLGLKWFFHYTMFRNNSQTNLPCVRVAGRPDVNCVKTAKRITQPRSGLDDNLLHKLQNFFEPYNQRLQMFLKQNFKVYADNDMIFL